MNGRMYVERNLGVERDRARYFFLIKRREHRCMQLHQYRISTLEGVRKDTLLPHGDNFIEKLHGSKQRTRHFATTSFLHGFTPNVVRQYRIQQDNEKLLNKLTEIAEGKLVGFHNQNRVAIEHEKGDAGRVGQDTELRVEEARVRAHRAGEHGLRQAAPPKALRVQQEIHGPRLRNARSLQNSNAQGHFLQVLSLSLSSLDSCQRSRQSEAEPQLSRGGQRNRKDTRHEPRR